MTFVSVMVTIDVEIATPAETMVELEVNVWTATG